MHLFSLAFMKRFIVLRTYGPFILILYYYYYFSDIIFIILFLVLEFNYNIFSENLNSPTDHMQNIFASLHELFTILLLYDKSEQAHLW